MLVYDRYIMGYVRPGFGSGSSGVPPRGKRASEGGLGSKKYSAFRVRQSGKYYRQLVKGLTPTRCYNPLTKSHGVTTGYRSFHGLPIQCAYYSFATSRVDLPLLVNIRTMVGRCDEQATGSTGSAPAARDERTDPLAYLAERPSTRFCVIYYTTSSRSVEFSIDLYSKSSTRLDHSADGLLM